MRGTIFWKLQLFFKAMCPDGSVDDMNAMSYSARTRNFSFSRMNQNNDLDIEVVSGGETINIQGVGM